MIEQKHSIPLTQAVNASTPGRGAVVETLYSEAETILFNKPLAPSRTWRTRQVIQDAKGVQHVLATVTDTETGLFVQLTALLDDKLKAVEGPYLVFGKKYLMETRSPQLSNNAIKLWR